jgi:hypothetical protein
MGDLKGGVTLPPLYFTFGFRTAESSGKAISKKFIKIQKKDTKHSIDQQIHD